MGNYWYSSAQIETNLPKYPEPPTFPEVTISKEWGEHGPLIIHADPKSETKIAPEKPKQVFPRPGMTNVGVRG